MLSFFLPKRIVYCSQKAIETHIKFGYDCTKSIYIPNGFSTDRFFPSIQKRTDFRDSLGLKFDTPLIGMAARFHPIKDHENFISAAAKLHKEMPEVKFVLCGTGIETSNTTLMNKIIENNLESSVLLLGYRSDMANFYNGIDVGTLTSISEAFPNVVGEMMACGLPVVITDVGDASDIVGDCGIVVPAKEPQALADAWMQTLMMKENERIELGKRAAHRIAHYFSIDLVVQSYKNLHEEIISQEIC